MLSYALKNTGDSNRFAETVAGPTTAGDDMSRKPRLKNLQIELDFSGLIFSVTPFRWARPAFKTQYRILGDGRSTQLFLGPLHVWTFSREWEFKVSFGASFNGCAHGTFKPTGDNAIPFFWRWLIGRQNPES